MSTDFKLNPNKGLGFFEIGQPLEHCIKHLQRFSQGEIKLCFCTENLFSLPLVVEDPSLGLELTFEPNSQKLQLIKVNTGAIVLTYGGKSISSPDQKTTLKSISHLFGPSFPGSYDRKSKLYTVEYGGACFQFSAGHSNLELMEDISLVSDLADERQPLLTRLFVFHGETIRSCTIPDLPEFSDYFMQVEVQPQRGLYFVSQKQNIDYHSHVQHVLGILGAPDKIFEHRAGEERKGEKLAYCLFPYFYNYFRLGLSIMFDSKSNRAIKFILNTNLIDRPDFGIWRKCNFTISVSKDTVITPNMDLSEIEELLGPATGPIINSSDEVSTRATKIYAYPNMLLEFTQVTKRLCRAIFLPKKRALNLQLEEEVVEPAIAVLHDSPLLSTHPDPASILPPPLSLTPKNTATNPMTAWPIEIDQDLPDHDDF